MFSGKLHNNVIVAESRWLRSEYYSHASDCHNSKKVYSEDVKISFQNLFRTVSACFLIDTTHFGFFAEALCCSILRLKIIHKILTL